MRQLLFRLLTVAIASTIALVSGELLIRVWGVMSTLPETFSLRQDLTGYAGEGVVFNSEGLRDKEYSRRKPNGSFRILLLGDSVTYGVSVSWGDTFAKQLETRLNGQQDHSFDVINTAVPSWNTVLEKEYLIQKGLSYQPDVVMIGFCLNDAEQLDIPPDLFERNPLVANVNNAIPVSAKAWAIPLLDWENKRAKTGIRPTWHMIKIILARYSHLYRFVRWRLDILNRSFGESSDPDYPNSLYRQDSKSWRECHEALQMIVSKAEESNGKVVVVIFPFFIKLKQNTLFGDTGYPWLSLHHQLKISCQALGITIIDMLPCFEGYDPREISIDPYHLNKRGHALAAAFIYRFLVAHQLLPNNTR